MGSALFIRLAIVLHEADLQLLAETVGYFGKRRHRIPMRADDNSSSSPPESGCC